MTDISAAENQELNAAQNATGAVLTGPIYRFVMVETDLQRPLIPDPSDPRRWLVRNRISVERTVFVDATGGLLMRANNDPWQSITVT